MVRRHRVGLCFAVASVLASGPNAAPGDLLQVSNAHPFAGVFGLPDLADARVLPAGESSIALLYAVTNHADAAADDEEAIVLDGESHRLGLHWERGISAQTSVGVMVPWVDHRGGSLDPFIDDWHEALGINSATRTCCDNQLTVRYTGEQDFDLQPSSAGLGDTRIWVERTLSPPGRGLSTVTRFNVKLPTGDADVLHGSGAADLALDIAARATWTAPRGEITVVGSAGLLYLGRGDVLPDLQKRTVPFAGAAGVWQVTPRWHVNLQVYGQGPYFESDLEELGGDSLLVSLGLGYRLPNAAGWTLQVGIVEDVFSNLTPDFAVHMQVSRRSFGGRPSLTTPGRSGALRTAAALRRNEQMEPF